MDTIQIISALRDLGYTIELKFTERELVCILHKKGKNSKFFIKTFFPERFIYQAIEGAWKEFGRKELNKTGNKS